MSVDPLTKSYPMLTPYQFASNRPIDGIDLDGLEYYYSASGKFIEQYGSSTEIRVITSPVVSTLAQNVLRSDDISDSEMSTIMNNSIKAYTNPDQAALEWAYKYNYITHFKLWNSIEKGHYRQNGEYGAKMGKRNVINHDNELTTLYVFGKTVSEGIPDKAGSHMGGGITLGRMSLYTGWDFYSTIHSHPYHYGTYASEKSGEDFSDNRNDKLNFNNDKADKEISIDLEMDTYLATPGGYLKKFLFKSEETLIIGRIPNHPDSSIGSGMPSFKYTDRSMKSIRKINYKVPTLQIGIR